MKSLLQDMGNRAVVLHKSGELAQAEPLYRQIIADAPDSATPRHLLGMLLAQLGRNDEALEMLDGALRLKPDLAAAQFQRANLLQEMNRLDEALAGYDRVSALLPQDAAIATNRGNVLQKQRRFVEALADYDRALALKPDYAQAHYNRGKTLCEMNETEAGFAAFRQSAALFQAEPDTREHPAHKAQHDAEQQAWLDTHHANAPKVDGPLFLDGGARVAGAAINPANALGVTQAWQSSTPQIVVIDDLLTPQAMAELRRFCLGSTMWRTAYEDGYMGAFPESGFACPLLAQIAVEFRDTFPAIFGAHPLLYLWAFQYNSQLKGTALHADAAAMNVNFWITPDDANLDPTHGGLVVWDKAAPLDWDFARFNGDIAASRKFLAYSGAKPITIPYRANRAVIFDSDLFHETDRIAFKDGYENRRVNVTMLYGERQLS